MFTLVTSFQWYRAALAPMSYRFYVVRRFRSKSQALRDVDQGFEWSRNGSTVCELVVSR
jgi:hypothetical protein